MTRKTSFLKPVVLLGSLAVLGVLAALLALGRAAATPGDTVADRVFGQAGSFTSNTCNLGGVSASSLCVPQGVAVDAGGNFYVADANNSGRVLEYNTPLTTDTVADRVFGQPDFTSNSCNLGNGFGGPASASSLCEPAGVALDAAGNLYVADYANSRVLEYNSPLTTDTVADRVFGQAGSFTSNTCNLGGVSADSLCNPRGVTLDAAGNVYVADFTNSRVLEYNSPLTTDTVADRVFGQGDSFTTVFCGLSASSLCEPSEIAVDAAAGNLYVADYNNSRVLEYDTPLTTDTVADRVFGQGGSFTSQNCNLGGISADSLCYPEGVAADAAGNLYVADWTNSRVLEYNSPLTTDTVADQVFGQAGSFTSGTCNLGGISAGSLCNPVGVAVDAAGNLYVGDQINRRVLEYDSPPTSTITVNTTIDETTVDGNCSLREAITAANTDLPVDACAAGSGADTIVVPAGAYTLSIFGAGEDGNETGDLDITSDLTINGSGAASTVIQACDSSGGPCTGIDRVFDIHDPVTVTISGVTIRNGDAGAAGAGLHGGGIHNDGTLTLANSTVSGNSADANGGGGGGIFNNGALTVTDSIVNGNSALLGGGIAGNAGPLTVTNSTVSGNSASGASGGGIYTSGPLTVTNSTVSGNSALGNAGGGIFSGGTMTLSDSTVSGNSAQLYGGGIYASGLTLNNSTVSGNSADAGGGIWGESLTINNSTVSGNSASTGGGIHGIGGTQTVSNSTVSGNSATSDGGGIFNDGATLTLDNSTVNGNSAAQAGGDIFNNGGSTATLKNTIVADSPSGGNCDGTVSSLGNNLSSDGSCAFSGPGDLNNTDPMLSLLADNGGPTQTHALLTGSPAIDAGNSDCPPPAADQRGVTRPQDGDGNGTAICDIGAFETQPIPPDTASGPVSAFNGGSVSTGDTPTASDPVETTVTVPAGTSGGTVTITESAVTMSPPSGTFFFGQQVLIDADSIVGTTFDNPLVITFRLDASLIANCSALSATPCNENTIVIFKDGVVVPNCDIFPGSTVAAPDPCVSNRTISGSGDVEITVLTSSASNWNFGVAAPGATFTVTKVFSDGNTFTTVSISLTCANGTVTDSPQSVTGSGSVTFHINGDTPPDTCTAAETVPTGYTGSGSPAGACSGTITDAPSGSASCTITNTPTGRHDVGVAGHGNGFNAPNTVRAGHTTSIHIRLQNFGSVTETQIGYKVMATCSGTCTGTVTLSAACTGTVGPLMPGATQVVSGCTATATTATGTWLFTLMVIHCGADGGPPCATNDGAIDVNNSNNTAMTKVTVT